MEPQKHFTRRRTIGGSVAGAALTVGLMAGGAAWGVTAADAETPTAATATVVPAAAPAPTPTPTHSGAHHHRARGVRGTITKIDGDTWTVHTKAGAPVTVKISSSTAFGTKKTPATRASFAVGNTIGALGKRQSDVVDAKRIVHLPRTAHTGGSTPKPSTGASS